MKKFLIIPVIIILFIIGIMIGKNLFRTEDVYVQAENPDENIIEENNVIETQNEVSNVVEKETVSYNIEGEYEPNYDDIFPGYVGTAFRYIFKDGQVTYYTDGEFEGYYTIEDNKLKIVFTKSYNPATGEPEEPEYLKGGIMTIIDDETIQNEEGLKFHRK